MWFIRYNTSPSATPQQIVFDSTKTGTSACLRGSCGEGALSMNDGEVKEDKYETAIGSTSLSRTLPLDLDPVYFGTFKSP